MPDFDAALKDYLGELARQGAPFVRAVVPPSRGPADIRAELAASLGAEPCDELVSWFAWHDGVDMTRLEPDDQEGSAMFGGFDPLDLTDAIRLSELFGFWIHAMLAGDSWHLPGESELWVAIASDKGDRIILANAATGAVRKVWQKDFSGLHRLEPDIASQLRVWLQLITGEMFWNSEARRWDTKGPWVEGPQDLYARAGY